MIDYKNRQGYNSVSVLKIIPLVLCMITPVWAALPADSTFTLENGMRVILSQVPDRQSVAILCYYTTGALDESEGFQGFSFFYGSMHGLFTTENQKSYYSFRRLTENGGIYENTSAHDSCHFLQLVTEEELNNALWSESENIFLLSPTEDELKHLIDFSVGIAERYRAQNALFNAHMWMYDQIFLSHPGYAVPLNGDAAQIRSWSTASILRQINRFKDPARVILVVTGSFDPDQAQDSIEKYFEGMGTPSPAQSGNAKAARANKSAPIRKRSWWRDNLDQHYLMIGYRLPGRITNTNLENEDYLISRAVVHYLTQPGINHLDHMINQVNKLQVNIVTDLTEHHHENALIIRLSAQDRTSLEKARLIVTSELIALENRKISPLHLKSIRAALKTGFYKKMANLGERALEIARNFHLFGQINPTLKFDNDLHKLDQTSFMRVIRRYFTEDKQILLYVYKKD